MFSPDSNAWIFNRDSKSEESRNAFRHPSVAVKLGGETETSDCHMNPPLRRGKYSMIVDDDGETVGTSELPKEGWKQCDYVSNRTRLRCRNVRKSANLKEYGFCEEHRGYIDRIRKEGLRAKHCFDPSFNTCQQFLHLTNDYDETLLPKHPDEFPFVYESLYCDNRIDDNDNPLSRAKVYTKREIVKQYVSALKRQDASIQQMRIIYQEKHRRTLHQIMELRGKTNLTKLNPNKDSQKIKRILAMRQYLLRRHNWDRILVRKLTDPTAMAAASIRRQKWKEIMASLSLNETELSILMSSDLPPKLNGGGTANKLGANDGMAASVPAFYPPRSQIKKTGEKDDATQTCARINLPWDGTRHKWKKFTGREPEKNNSIINNNNINTSNNNKLGKTISYGTYQQYLSLQHLIPGSRYSLAKTISRT